MNYHRHIRNLPNDMSEIEAGVLYRIMGFEEDVVVTPVNGSPIILGKISVREKGQDGFEKVNQNHPMADKYRLALASQLPLSVEKIKPENYKTDQDRNLT